MNRIVITGIGAVTPLAETFRGSWQAALDGRVGVDMIRGFDASDLRWRSAGEISGFSPGRIITQKEQRRIDLFAQYAVAAADEALASSGLCAGSAALANAGVVVGSSRGGIRLLEEAWSSRCASGRPRGTRHRLSPYLMPATTISMAASAVARHAGSRGICLGISNACASGTIAIGEAFRMLRTGHGSPIIAGGTDAPVCRTCVEGYGASGALSRRTGPSASRPFHRDRDGFVLGEGACLMVLERLEDALRRNARILGEIIGYGNSSDVAHITHPSLDGEIRAMREAFPSACLTGDAVDLVYAHGTSTPAGDRIESEAIRAVFGERTGRVPVTAVKSMTGHMLAGSGAFEAACTLMSLREGVIPPTRHLDDQDPACMIHVVREKTSGDYKTALSNSFGFGGINAVLAFRRFDG